LLAGGIPEGYAVALVSPSCNEKEQLINGFLNAGVERNETTFYLTAETGTARKLVEKYTSIFRLFISNRQVDAALQKFPNVVKLNGVENLTEINIAIEKSFRTVDSSSAARKRICIDIVSDVLLQHHAVVTRKWLSDLLISLKSKGFTTLAVVNPQMHPSEEVHAVLGLFEGEISLSMKAPKESMEKTLAVQRLSSHKYL
jgi:KaiC/GvpD/RAD55 family RecA-like ATPase